MLFIYPLLVIKGLLYREPLLPLKLDVLIKLGLALLTLRQEVETDTADVFLRFEVAGVIDLVAFNLELHQAPGIEANFVATT